MKKTSQTEKGNVSPTARKTAYSYIRFSTPQQSLGDSERRQVALAKDWCDRNGFTLAEPVADRGVSAYHGKHYSRGALGQLLKEMEAGQVLIIEDCDRWSREDPIEALTRLRDEVRRGIEVVFLRTGTRVNKENFSDIGVLVPNFFGALLANGESTKKGGRIQAIWAKKKELVKAGKQVRLNRLPCWLLWDEQQGKAIVVERAAAVVRQLFEMACAGKCLLDIARAAQSIPPIVRGWKRLTPRWNISTIRKLLLNKAVTGCYVDGDFTVPDYWPVVVSEEVFALAQAKLKLHPKRDTRPGHKSESNLFTGLAVCGRCGKQHLVAHNSNPGCPRKLICGGAAKGRTDCGFTGAPVELIEKSFLSLMANADLLRPLLSTGDQCPSKLEELKARLEEHEKQAGKLEGIIMRDDEPSTMLVNRLKLEEKRVKTLRAEIEEEELNQRANQPARVAYEEFNAALPALAKDPTRRPDLRRAISIVLEKLVLDPHGDGNGRYTYDVYLRGVKDSVTVVSVLKPFGWVFRSLRPEQKAALAS